MSAEITLSLEEQAAFRRELKEQWIRGEVKRVFRGGSSEVETWSPHKPYGRGKLFIEDLRNEKEVFYGGAAGGMKSDHLLQAALEYVDVPGYAAILFRRTYKDLSKPEALMSRAHQWLAPHVKTKRIRWNAEAHQFIWAHSGAILAFGHLDNENDKLERQSRLRSSIPYFFVKPLTYSTH